MSKSALRWIVVRIGGRRAAHIGIYAAATAAAAIRRAAADLAITDPLEVKRLAAYRWSE